MKRRDFLKTTTAIVVAEHLPRVATELAADNAVDAPAASQAFCDVFVYGSTPGGVAAAVQAARQG
jgi:alkyl hydroperoxide reductase subunit AhpF